MKVQIKLGKRENLDTGHFEDSSGVKLGVPELREDGAFPKIRGYAAVFNQLSQPMWGMRERIKPGAFKATLAAGADVRALFNHDPSQILGRTKAATLALEEDSIGLRYVINPPDTTVGRDLMVNIRRGDITQSSFGFRSVDEEYKKENGQFVRELVSVELFDVSPVTYPAYTGTSVNVRTRFPGMKEEEFRTVVEPFFRDVMRIIEPPLHHLPECEKKSRARSLELKGEELHRQQERERVSLQIQTVIFDKRSWTSDRAKVWLADHGYSHDKFDEQVTALRFGQTNPAEMRGELEAFTEGMPRGVTLLGCRK